VEYAGKTLIHIFIPISSQVHKCSNKIYDRSADGDFELTSNEQIKNLYVRKSALYSENTIYPFLFESDFESGIVDRVRKMIKIQRPEHPWNELDNNEFFKIAGLYRKDMATGLEGFTMSALLLFGKPESIGSAIPHFKIDALLRVRDIERYDDRENIRCNLVQAYDLLMKFVAKHLPDKFYLEGDQRISLRETIFREVVANLLIHREYTNAFPSTFIIYADRLEVKNANKPHSYGQLLPLNFEPFPKNPHIAQIFTQMGRSEELGTGIRKVHKYSKAYSGSEDITFLEHDTFKTIVPLGVMFSEITHAGSDLLRGVHGGINGGINGGIYGGINEGINELLQFIKGTPGKRTNEIAETIDVPAKTVEKWIAILKKKGKIEFKGSKKTGGYYTT
jgi:ATP-dependent DNA helicase RecG